MESDDSDLWAVVRIAAAFVAVLALGLAVPLVQWLTR